GETTFRVVEAPPDGVGLRARRPRWATVERVHLNGEPTPYVVEKNYLRVLERLRSGDELIVTFPIGLRLEPSVGMLASLSWRGPTGRGVSLRACLKGIAAEPLQVAFTGCRRYESFRRSPKRFRGARGMYYAGRVVGGPRAAADEVWPALPYAEWKETYATL